MNIRHPKRILLNFNDKISAKNSIKGIENDFVQSFLVDIDNNFYKSKYNIAVITEPLLECGVPDIVLVLWDDRQNNYWDGKRSAFNKTDIKLLHFFYQISKWIEVESIENQLGYSRNIILKAITKLNDAGFINEKNGKVKLRKLSEIFIIKSIISIEAKINDWKRAFEQAKINEWFSSESYILLPKDKIKENLQEYSLNSGVGIMGYKNGFSGVLCKSEKRKVPVSYASWLFNEWLGQCIYYKNFKEF